MTEHVRDRHSPSTPLTEINLEPRQFRLTEQPHPGASRVGPFWLSHHTDLPKITVTDATGSPAGVLLGFPIDLAASSVIEDCWIAPDGADLNTDKGRQDTLMALGGSFLWICITDNCARIYPDACAQIGCVWDKATRSAGATARAILGDDDYVTRFDHAQFARLRLPGEGWFPAGLTTHSGVTRLLPNHFLDLSEWNAERFHTSMVELAGQAPDAIVSDIIDTLQRQIVALLALPQRCAMTLTAGYHTRALLACALPWADQITFVTIEDSGRSNADPIVAEQIATDFDLTHWPLARKQASRQQQETYLRRSGHCVADGFLRLHTCLSPLASDHILIGGIGGAVGAAVDEAARSNVVLEDVLAQLGMRGSDKTLRHMRDWFAGLEDLLPAQISEHAHVENFLACCAMLKFYAAPTLTSYAPFATYRCFALMRALPAETKRDNGVARAIINRLSPGLNTYPFNIVGRPISAGDESRSTGLASRLL